MNRYKIYKMVQYIRNSSFEFEVHEVEENLHEILTLYGFDIELTAEEELLKFELTLLAEQWEFSEVARLVLGENRLTA
ncbi:hypothetical protein J4401_03265 [Candidatus Woesearchaeota archaeon]|nr:hypothetical protein [Candidatus Woesearchaeota archaeon]